MLRLSDSCVFGARSRQHVGVRRRERSQLRASSAIVRGEGAPLRVVLTGGSKGLGLALASEFVKNGDSVLLSSRAAGRVNEAVAQLRAQHSSERVYGLAADCSRANDVEELTALALEKMGGVDVWINNAATNGYTYVPLIDADPAMLEEIVRTNALGTLLCCRAAIRLMQKQPRGGHVFNLEGGGSDGAATKLFSAYGFTKAGIPQLNKSLQEEVKDTGVRVHSISPGMVFTELVSSGSNAFGSQGRFFVNAVAQAPEDVAAEIVPRVRELALAPQAQSQPGQTINVFTPQVAATKLLRRLFLGENKDKYFPEDDKEFAKTLNRR